MELCKFWFVVAILYCINLSPAQRTDAAAFDDIVNALNHGSNNLSPEDLKSILEKLGINCLNAEHQVQYSTFCLRLHEYETLSLISWDQSVPRLVFGNLS